MSDPRYHSFMTEVWWRQIGIPGMSKLCYTKRWRKGKQSARGKQIKESLDRARARGVVLGGLREATKEANWLAHAEAVERAKKFENVLINSVGKSLRQVSNELFSAGCMTRGGKPLSASQVKRMLSRVNENPELDFSRTAVIAQFKAWLIKRLSESSHDMDQSSIKAVLSEITRNTRVEDALLYIGKARHT
jgi:hypothetical protein